MKYPANPLEFVKYTASMSAKMHREATDQAKREGYGSLSGYVQELIRADLAGTGQPSSDDTAALRPTSSRRSPRRRARK